MQLEHCHKCKKQIEFPKKKKDIGKYYPFDATTDMVEKCKMELGKDSNYTEFHYCNSCYYDLKILLSTKGFIKQDEAK